MFSLYLNLIEAWVRIFFYVKMMKISTCVCVCFFLNKREVNFVNGIYVLYKVSKSTISKVLALSVWNVSTYFNVRPSTVCAILMRGKTHPTRFTLNVSSCTICFSPVFFFTFRLYYPTRRTDTHGLYNVNVMNSNISRATIFKCNQISTNNTTTHENNIKTQIFIQVPIDASSTSTYSTVSINHNYTLICW